MSASNSIAVVRSGKGGDVGGVIGKAGLSISVSLDRSEGFHQAVRNLAAAMLPKLRAHLGMAQAYFSGRR